MIILYHYKKILNHSQFLILKRTRRSFNLFFYFFIMYSIFVIFLFNSFCFFFVFFNSITWLFNWGDNKIQSINDSWHISLCFSIHWPLFIERKSLSICTCQIIILYIYFCKSDSTIILEMKSNLVPNIMNCLVTQLAPICIV